MKTMLVCLLFAPILLGDCTPTDETPMPPPGCVFGSGCNTIYVGFKPRKDGNPAGAVKVPTIQKKI